MDLDPGRLPGRRDVARRAPGDRLRHEARAATSAGASHSFIVRRFPRSEERARVRPGLVFGPVALEEVPRSEYRLVRDGGPQGPASA